MGGTRIDAWWSLRRTMVVLAAWSLGLPVHLPSRDAWAQEPAPSSLQAALQLQQAVVEAIARAERSVVAIARVRKGASEALGAPGPENPDFIPHEFGTGVIWDREGHIVTNYHVLGDPRENDYYVWVQGTAYRAAKVLVPRQVLAGDPWTDLAVLKIDAQDLQPVALGDTTQLRKGMFVVALGNPYAIARDGRPSASWGIIANLNRTAPPGSGGSGQEGQRDSLHHFGTLIQTDARLHLGTSGGALINLKGEMIGLTTSLAALTGVETAAGFAIPVDQAFRDTVETLKQGRVPDFGFLGVQPDHLSMAERRRGRQGARVLRIVPGSPAAAAGLQEEDVIVAVDGRPIADRDALFRQIGGRFADTPVTLTVLRRDPRTGQDRTLTLQATLAKKYIAAAQPPYSVQRPPRWRGIQVEYPSALPPQLSRQGLGLADPEGSVAVLDVQPDSPAWRAGLRPGDLVTHVRRRRVRTPREFHQAVAGLSGPVQLQIISIQGRRTEVTVPPQAPQ